MNNNGRRNKNGRSPDAQFDIDDYLSDIEQWNDDLEDLLVDDSNLIPPMDDEEAVMTQFLHDMEPEGDWGGPSQRQPVPASMMDEQEEEWDSLETGRKNARQSQSPPLSSSWRAAEMRETQALLSTLAQMLAVATSATQAMGLAAAMVPVVLRTQPPSYRALWPVLPALTFDVVRVTHSWHRHSVTRPYLEQLPQILTAVTAELGSAVTQKRPLSAQLISRLFKQQVARQQLPGLPSIKRHPQRKKYRRQPRRDHEELW